MNKTYLVPGMASLLVLPTLQGCVSEEPPMQTSDTGVEMTRVQEGAIVVDPHKCVGCGRCARVAAQNFVMDRETRKAVVISSISTNSTEKAIDICPVEAISKS